KKRLPRNAIAEKAIAPERQAVTSNAGFAFHGLVQPTRTRAAGSAIYAPYAGGSANADGTSRKAPPVRRAAEKGGTIQPTREAARSFQGAMKRQSAKTAAGAAGARPTPR